MRIRQHAVQLCVLLALCAGTATAQTPVSMTVDLGRQYPISPYIYGSNGHSDDREENVAARRLGGNRLTGYNWETNASNAGSDWHHSSDNYLPWNAGIPDSHAGIPGIVMTAFHDTSVAMGAYSLLTLPMAGFAAKDKNGTVAPGETAPSSRWAAVVHSKPGPVGATPDTTDNTVYTDELLQMLIGRYGNAAAATGICGYALDNEPALWAHTHPRIVPTPISVASLLERSVELASTIKRVDPQAEVFGPALYGFSAYMNLQEAPDWNAYSSSYRWFIDVYLDSMRQASQAAGTRLLDVLDVHWYPEPAGVYAGDTSLGAVERRLQAPRSLWDSSYVEDSWIGTWFSPVAILHQLRHSIATYYPGTKLAVTEYNYGAPHHVSGGLAQADALGIFGRMGVYFASRWGSLDGYISIGYKLFRNYDGNASTFGATGVHAGTSDDARTSIYASKDGDTLHIVLLNKSFETVQTTVAIDGGTAYRTPEVWTFDAADSALTAEQFTGALDDGTLTMQLAPLTAYHLVLPPDQSSSVGEPAATRAPVVDARQNGSELQVRYSLQGLPASLVLADMTGRTVYATQLSTAHGEIALPVHTLGTGAYILALRSATAVVGRTIVLVP